MSKNRNCPICNEHLWLWRGGDHFSLACSECGWKSGVVTLAAGQNMQELIAATVEAAQGEASE